MPSSIAYAMLIITKMALAEQVGRSGAMKTAKSQPTLDAIRRVFVAPGVSADMLLFEKDERGPDEELKLQFKAVSRLDPEEKVIRSVIESIILRNTMKEAERGFSLAHLAGHTGGSPR